MKRAIVLVSGGMDSCVTASFAKKHEFELYFLHINYGQKTEKRELQSFNQIADFFNAKERLIIDMKYFLTLEAHVLLIQILMYLMETLTVKIYLYLMFHLGMQIS